MKNFTRVDQARLLARMGFQIVNPDGSLSPADNPVALLKVKHMGTVKHNGNRLMYSLHEHHFEAIERDEFGREVAGCTETYNSFHKRRRQALTERINQLKAGRTH